MLVILSFQWWRQRKMLGGASEVPTVHRNLGADDGLGQIVGATAPKPLGSAIPEGFGVHQ